MKKSAGILMYKTVGTERFYFLVHPGGPFWRNKDWGHWSIPKGELAADEQPLERAKKEFFEETGQVVAGDFLCLNPIRQKAGKMVYAWAVQGDIDPSVLQSNTFPLEWPPKSGKISNFPEVDQWAWFSATEAKKRINAAQAAFIDEMETLIALSKH